jgi:Secretion system C-terminal sorting domain
MTHMNTRFLLKTIVAVLSLFGYKSHAQVVVRPLGYNPALYAPAIARHDIYPASHIQTKGYFGSKGNILLDADTLTLPFFDDFTYNTLRPNHLNYTPIYRIYGPCDTAYRLNVVYDSFSLAATYTYSFNTTSHLTDSVINIPAWFYTYPSSCFGTVIDSILLYPKAHRIQYDTSGKRAIDTLYPQDRVFQYAPVIYRTTIPKTSRWMDNQAWVNRTLAINPPSLGVATLDGLNQYGQPYNRNATINPASADTLTSKPIDLSGLVTADSLYLSFFYEAKGFGDVPNKGDSLVLEFYNGASNQWDHIWSRTINDSVVMIDTAHIEYHHFLNQFEQVLIPLQADQLPSRIYRFNGFQFRFRNYASIAGNNDHWHIDYVRLDKGRSRVDTTSNDIAYVYDYPSILKPYYTMPSWQYQGQVDLLDSISMTISNLNTPQAVSNPPSTTFLVDAQRLYPNPASVCTYTSTFNAGKISTIPLQPVNIYTLPITTIDSMEVVSQSYITNPNSFTGNDTVRHNQLFGDVLAYDDGSAERAIGVENLGIKKFGYEFTLHNPDTLVGYQILYSSIDVDVRDLVFTFNLWDSIELQNPLFKDSAIYTSDNRSPYYLDSVNGFTTYRIPPFPLPKKFYFGWSQTDTRNLQVGYDIHSTRGVNHLYFFTSGEWTKEVPQLKGSPMIRLLLRHSTQGTSGIQELTAANMLAVYPNPTSDKLHIVLPDELESYSVQITDALGQQVIAQQLQGYEIATASLSQGMYLIHLTDSKGKSYRSKFIKSNESQ